MSRFQYFDVQGCQDDVIWRQMTSSIITLTILDYVWHIPRKSHQRILRYSHFPQDSDLEYASGGRKISLWAIEHYYYYYEFYILLWVLNKLSEGDSDNAYNMHLHARYAHPSVAVLYRNEVSVHSFIQGIHTLYITTTKFKDLAQISIRVGTSVDGSGPTNSLPWRCYWK